MTPTRFSAADSDAGLPHQSLPRGFHRERRPAAASLVQLHLRDQDTGLDNTTYALNGNFSGPQAIIEGTSAQLGVISDSNGSPQLYLGEVEGTSLKGWVIRRNRSLLFSAPDALQFSFGAPNFTTPYFTFTPQGFFGIGSSNPIASLQGPSPANTFDETLRLEGTETSGAADIGAAISFSGNNGGGARHWGWIRGMKENGTSGDNRSYLAFATRSTGGPRETMRLDSNGDLTTLGTVDGV